MDYQPSQRRAFAALSGFTLIAATSLVVAVWPMAADAARAQSQTLSERGQRATGNQAVTYYHLATWLDQKNTKAQLGLAEALLASHQPEAALIHLDQVPTDSTAKLVKLKILIELGDRTQIAAAVATLAQSERNEDLHLACLAYTYIDQPSACQALMDRITDSEALRRVNRAQSGKLPLATELAASGLLNSSYAILRDQPASLIRNLLMARIAYNRSTKLSLAEARTLLEQAVGFDPSNIECRQLLAATYKATGNAVAAHEQQALIAKLISGRP